VRDWLVDSFGMAVAFVCFLAVLPVLRIASGRMRT